LTPDFSQESRIGDLGRHTKTPLCTIKTHQNTNKTPTKHPLSRPANSIKTPLRARFALVWRSFGARLALKNTTCRHKKPV
jgi:hypothetical protein